MQRLAVKHLEAFRATGRDRKTQLRGPLSSNSFLSEITKHPYSTDLKFFKNGPSPQIAIGRVTNLQTPGCVSGSAPGFPSATAGTETRHSACTTHQTKAHRPAVSPLSNRARASRRVHLQAQIYNKEDYGVRITRNKIKR